MKYFYNILGFVCRRIIGRTLVVSVLVCHNAIQSITLLHGHPMIDHHIMWLI